MIELGQLEKNHSEFENRHVRVVAISNDDQEASRLTQADAPHLVVVADTDQNMARALEVIHEKMGPKEEDTNAPTTFLVDGAGKVLWFGRPNQFIARLSPDEVLAAIDQHLHKD